MIARKKTNNKINKYKLPRIIKICCAVFILSLVSRIYFTSSFAAKNVMMRDLYVQKGNLQQEVTRLQYDDLKLSSLENIKQRAYDLSFVNQEGVLLSLDLTVSPPLALR